MMIWLAERGCEYVEQPLAKGEEDEMPEIFKDRPLPIFLDESIHFSEDVPEIADRCDGVNIKLMKTGGLTEALKLADAARAAGLGIMVGCMIGTSLAMAPATLVAARAAFVDLDGPLLLARDRDPGIAFEGSVMSPPPAALWG